jgi:hypothetical protein
MLWAASVAQNLFWLISQITSSGSDLGSRAMYRPIPRSLPQEAIQGLSGWSRFGGHTHTHTHTHTRIDLGHFWLESSRDTGTHTNRPRAFLVGELTNRPRAFMVAELTGRIMRTHTHNTHRRSLQSIPPKSATGLSGWRAPRGAFCGSSLNTITHTCIIITLVCTIATVALWTIHVCHAMP